MDKYRKLNIAASPITEIAIGFLGYGAGVGTMFGSGVLILPNLALTARHVVINGLSRIDPSFELGVTPDASAFIIGIQFVGNMVSNVYRVTQTFFDMNHEHDLVLLRLEPYSVGYPELKFYPPILTFTGAKKHSKVFAVGYATPPASLTVKEENSDGKLNVNLFWKDGLSITEGKVTKTYPKGASKPLLPYPCFRADMRTDDGMSGGPVFNDQGVLCGITTFGGSTMSDSVRHSTFSATLEPLLGMTVQSADGNFYRVDELFRRAGVRDANDIAPEELASLRKRPIELVPIDKIEAGPAVE